MADDKVNMAPGADSREWTLHVEGMTCGSCVARVERALCGAPGVEEAYANLATASARVRTKPGTTEAALTDALRRAGYSGSTRPTGVFDPLEIATQRSAAQRATQREAFVLAAAGCIALMLLAMLAPAHRGWQAAQALITTGLLIGPAGRRILAGGTRALLHLAPNMDALVTVGVGAAYGASVVSLLTGSDGAYFPTVAMILTFINGGKLLEAAARDRAGQSVADLVQRLPRVATCRRDHEWTEVPISELRRGDRLRVVPEGIVPVDGDVVAGTAAIDESLVTGESRPRRRTEGERVLGGTIVREGAIEIDATGVGGDTLLGRIVRAVADAQSGKTRMQRIADRVAGVFVPIVIGLALLTAGLWLLAPMLGWVEADATRGWTWAVRCAVAVLVIACPCAMGLATPTAVLVATGRAAAQGILVRSPAALEAAGRVQTILFDKTGTLTTGQFEVEEVYDEPVDPIAQDARDLLRRAAAAEAFSTHPLAKALVAKAREWELTLPEPTEFASEVGRGVKAKIENHELLVGSPRWLTDQGVDIGPIREKIANATAVGRTVVAIAIDGTCAGFVGLMDRLRDDASATVQRLNAAGYQTALLTGDAPETARAVAARTNLTHASAALMPEDKLAEVKRLQQAGKVVAFVGDGSNDAPALAAADVGIAFAAGTDIANEAADLTIVGAELGAVVTAVNLARESLRVIRQNLFWAFFYNCAAIPLAALGQVPPGAAAAAMMFSSISVVVNALRLRRK